MKGKHGIYTLEAHGSCRSVAFRGTTGAQDVDARRGGEIRTKYLHALEEGRHDGGEGVEHDRRRGEDERKIARRERCEKRENERGEGVVEKKDGPLERKTVSDSLVWSGPLGAVPPLSPLEAGADHLVPTRGPAKLRGLLIIRYIYLATISLPLVSLPIEISVSRGLRTVRGDFLHRILRTFSPLPSTLHEDLDAPSTFPRPEHIHSLIMSSSDEEVVRRPGRSAGAGQPASPSGSEQRSEHNGSAARDQSPVASDTGNMNMDDDDADLFGSDGSDGGFGNDTEYG